MASRLLAIALLTAGGLFLKKQMQKSRTAGNAGGTGASGATGTAGGASGRSWAPGNDTLSSRSGSNASGLGSDAYSSAPSGSGLPRSTTSTLP